MQLIINLNELNGQQRVGLFAILELLTPVGATPDETHENLQHIQGKLAVEEKVEDAPVKKTRAKRTETQVEDTKGVEPIPEPTEDKNESSITLQDLKEKAQDLVKKVDRDKVKAAISQFADKLSEVKSSDYSALMKAFKELE